MFRVRVKVRVSDSISFVVNIVLKIAGREIPLALCLSTYAIMGRSY